MENSAAEPSKRQALFARFSRRALAELKIMAAASPAVPRPLIMLTGGLSTPELMQSALSHGHSDLLGIARLSVTSPELPRLLEQRARGRKAAQVDVKHMTFSNLNAGHILESCLVSLWTRIPDRLRPQFPRLIGAGAEMASYTVAMRSLSLPPIISEFEEHSLQTGLAQVIHMWLYVAPGPWPPWVQLGVSLLVVAAAFLLWTFI